MDEERLRSSVHSGREEKQAEQPETANALVAHLLPNSQDNSLGAKI